MIDIFSRILEISITSCFLIVAVLIVRGLIFKKVPKWTICLLWLLVGIKLLVPFSIESRFSIVPDFSVEYENEYEKNQSSEDPSESINVVFSEESVSFGSITEVSVEVSEDYSENVSFDFSEPVSEHFSEESFEVISMEEVSENIILRPEESFDGDMSFSAVASGEYEQNVASSADVSSSLKDKNKSIKLSKSTTKIFAIVWLLGAVSILLYGVLQYLRLKKRVAVFTPCEDRIRKCAMIDSPFVFGVFSPYIYLPFGLSEKTEKYIVEHEKAHIKRFDYISKVIAYVILCVYWFNPLVWVSFTLLCKDIEYACDEKVLENYCLAEKKEYAMALLECSVKGTTISACPVAFGEIGVKERVKNTLSYKKPFLWIIILCFLLCVVLACLFLTKPQGEKENSGEISENVSEYTSETVSEYISEEISDNGKEDDQSKGMTAIDLYVPNDEVTGFDIIKSETNGTINDIILQLISKKALPEGTKANSFNIQGKTANIDLSADFGKALERGTTEEEMLTGSLFNTIIKFYNVDSVTFTIEKKIFETGHVRYDFPIGFIGGNDGENLYICGNNLTCRIEDKNVLVISGTGKMFDYKSISGSYGSQNPFKNKKLNNIEKIIIEEGVTSIGMAAFEHCHSLKSVVLPSTLEHIGENAFNNCQYLESIKIPNSVNTIGNYAFMGCHRLKTAQISALSQCGDGVFSGCDKLENATLEYGTKSIGAYMFAGCGLKSIELPDTVERIEQHAFFECSSLKNIKLSKNLKTVGHSAFRKCSCLKSVTLGDSVNYIGVYAFAGCTSLNNVSLGKNISFFGKYSFYNTEIYNDKANFKNDMLCIGEYLILPEKECDGKGNELDILPDMIEFDLYVPDKDATGFDVIKSSTVNGAGIMNDIILQLVSKKAIPEGTKVNYFQVEGKTAKIDLSAEFGKALERGATEEEMVTGSLFNTIIKFYNVDKVTFTIEGEIFETDYVRYDFPIGFNGGQEEMPVQIKYDFGVHGTYKWNLSEYGVLTIMGKGTVEDIDGEDWNKSEYRIKQIIIQEGITGLDRFAFADKKELVSVTLPESLKRIGDYAFSVCDALENISLPKNLEYVGCGVLMFSAFHQSETNWEDGVLYCGNVLLETNGEALPEHCVVKHGTRLIARLAFGSVQKPFSIKVPETVEIICEDAFYNCIGLREINIPLKVEVIEKYTFYNCQNLNGEIIIPQNVKKIGEHAFTLCGGLTSVAIENENVQMSVFDPFDSHVLIKYV